MAASKLNRPERNKFGMPYALEKQNPNRIIKPNEGGVYDLLQGGTINVNGKIRIWGTLGQYGAYHIDSLKSLDFRHLHPGFKGLEIDRVMEGPIRIEPIGMHSPEWQLFAEVVDA